MENPLLLSLFPYRPLGKRGINKKINNPVRLSVGDATVWKLWIRAVETKAERQREPYSYLRVE